jgi:hypothetical protein
VGEPSLKLSGQSQFSPEISQSSCPAAASSKAGTLQNKNHRTGRCDTMAVYLLHLTAMCRFCFSKSKELRKVRFISVASSILDLFPVSSASNVQPSCLAFERFDNSLISPAWSGCQKCVRFGVRGTFKSKLVPEIVTAKVVYHCSMAEQNAWNPSGEHVNRHPHGKVDGYIIQGFSNISFRAKSLTTSAPPSPTCAQGNLESMCLLSTPIWVPIFGWGELFNIVGYSRLF